MLDISKYKEHALDHCKWKKRNPYTKAIHYAKTDNDKHAFYAQ